MAKQSTKVDARFAALDQLACTFAHLVCESQSLSEMLGDLTRSAAAHVTNEDDVNQFADACKRHCESAGLTEGSFKVYLSNIRGVLRAMLKGYKPADGAPLRSMYDNRPDSGTGKRQPRTKGAGTSVAPQDTKPAASVTATREDLIRLIFGHCDAQLVECVEWAAKHETEFVRFVTLAIKGSQRVEGLKKAA